MGKKKVTIHRDRGEPQTFVVNSDKDAQRYEDQAMTNEHIVYVQVTDA
ncbi:hypothetical protein [Saccharopolyspora sp. 6V]|nr:hypothetical protein [Saccharopolyspora sp. 6V]MCA1194174.1 hypothetical protein [Saccharopolyspora sp. 6V]